MYNRNKNALIAVSLLFLLVSTALNTLCSAFFKIFDLSGILYTGADLKNAAKSAYMLASGLLSFFLLVPLSHGIRLYASSVRSGGDNGDTSFIFSFFTSPARYLRSLRIAVSELWRYAAGLITAYSAMRYANINSGSLSRSAYYHCAAAVIIALIIPFFTSQRAKLILEYASSDDRMSVYHAAKRSYRAMKGQIISGAADDIAFLFCVIVSPLTFGILLAFSAAPRYLYTRACSEETAKTAYDNRFAEAEKRVGYKIAFLKPFRKPKSKAELQ